MTESWEFTEKEAEEHPAVIIHKAKLAATSEEQTRRKAKAEEERQSKEESKEEIRRGKLVLRRKEAQKKELRQVGEKVEGAAVSLFTAPFRMIRRQPIGKIKKPIHPDKLVVNRELYFGGKTPASEIMPLGRPMTDWRELYFGQGPVKKDAAKVLNALMSGASDIESVEVYTGLEEKRIRGALKFLQQQGYDVEFAED